MKMQWGIDVTADGEEIYGFLELRFENGGVAVNQKHKNKKF